MGVKHRYPPRTSFGSEEGETQQGESTLQFAKLFQTSPHIGLTTPEKQ